MGATTRLCIVSFLILIGGIGGGAAATLNVPSTAYPTIQSAIDAAVTGGEVVVSPGTYHERINVNGKALTVRSTDPNDPAVVGATIIDGDAGGSVVTFSGAGTAGAVLTGFTITNGTGSELGGWFYFGGGIACGDHSSPVIVGNTIVGNRANYGGGIGCNNHSFPTITRNTITGNGDPNAWGGGIFCVSSLVIITGNVITGNTGAWGAGISCDISTVTISGDTIVANDAANGWGGGVFCMEAAVTVRDSIIAFSTHSRDGIHLTSGTVPTVTYCDVYGNAGGDYGTGVTAGTGSISIDPLFADRTHYNFRLKSQGGRWDGLTWVLDTVTSPCIDAGDPATVWTDEPNPNGGRVNMGFDGNTATASKTPDYSPPTVTLYQPQGTAVSAQFPTVRVGFSMPMNKTTAQAAFLLKKSNTTTAVAGTFAWVGNEMQYKVKGAFDPLATYRVTVYSTAKSSTGTPMGTNFTWTFTTNNVPAISFSLPQGTAVPRNAMIRLGFNEAMNKTVTQTAFSLKQVGATARVAGAFIWVGNEMRFTPTTPLAASTSYRVALQAAAQSSTGVPMAQAFAWEFTTVAASAPAMVTAAAAPTAQGAEIVVNLASAADVAVTICNLAGRPVALLTPENLDAGTHTLLWNGMSALGTRAPGGTYLIEVAANVADGQKASVLTPLRLGR